MLFHKFRSQEERREFSGSDFIELQYCRLPHGSDTAKIVATDAIENWKNDSLYIYGDDMDVFCANYEEIITGGLYNNMSHGPIDPYGINFYSREQSGQIVQLLCTRKPLEYETLLTWLEEGKKYIGFYVLGV